MYKLICYTRTQLQIYDFKRKLDLNSPDSSDILQKDIKFFMMAEKKLTKKYAPAHLCCCLVFNVRSLAFKFTEIVYFFT